MTIGQILASWGLSVDPACMEEFSNFELTCASPLTSKVRSFAPWKVRCSHDSIMSLGKFLDSSLEDFSQGCQARALPQTPMSKLGEVYRYASNIVLHQEMSLESALAFHPQLPVEEIFRPHSQVSNLRELRHLKVVERARAAPQETYEILVNFATDGYTWCDPLIAKRDASQTLAYVKPWLEMEEMLPELWEAHYGRINDALFIAPLAFIQVREAAEIHAEDKTSSYAGFYLKHFPDAATVATLGGFPLIEWEKVLTEDSLEVQENLSVFSENMSLKDAVAAARVI